MKEQEYNLLKQDNNADWFRVAIQENKLGNPKFPESVLPFLTWVVPMLDEIFPDHYDIQITYKSNYLLKFQDGLIPFKGRMPLIEVSISIIIHFPHILITNTDESKLDLYDLYVKIPTKFEEDVIRISSLQGLRQTITKREALIGYRHSHLGSLAPSNPPDFSGFCLGTGEINDVMGLWNNQQTPQMFEFLLHMIQPYLEWESIEGTPYTYIKSVLNYQAASSREPNSNFSNKFWECVKHHLTSEAENIILSMNVTNANVTVAEDNRLQDFLMKIYQTYASTLYSFDSAMTAGSVVYEDNTPIQNTLADVSSTPIRVSEETFLFKGEQRGYKILEEEKLNLENERKRKIHPNITKHVKRELESTFKKGILKNYVYKRLCDSNHPLKRGRRSDSLPL